MVIRRHRNKAMGVIQLTMDGELIAKYESQKAAYLSTGIHFNTINLAVNGRKQSACGYKWIPFALTSNKIRQGRDVVLKKEVKEYLSYINRREVQAYRTCLFCGKTFWSKSPKNRRCAACNEKVEGYQERLCSVFLH